MIKNSKILNTFKEYAISIIAFILLWYIYTSLNNVPEFILPNPKKVGITVIELIKSGIIWRHLWVTTFEVLLGFVLGALMGGVLGYIFVKVDFLKTALMPYFIFIQTAPKIALVPLFVVWFGIGLTSKIVLIISMVLFTVLFGTILGLESIPHDVRNLMKVLKAKKYQVFTKIEFMYSLPALFSSLKIGIVQAVIGAIVAEWMSGKEGLGYILTYASATYNTPMLLAGIVFTIILGIVTYEIVSVIENRVLYWHESKIE